jgi:hypothetical protein
VPSFAHISKQPELNRLSQSQQTLSGRVWFRFIFQGWNKMAEACAASLMAPRQGTGDAYGF